MPGRLSLLHAGPQGVVAPSSLLTGLKGFWTAGDGASLGLDASGLAHDLTLHNSPTAVAALVGNGAQFAGGSNQWMDVADHADLSGGVGVRYTFGCFVKFGSVATGCNIIGKSDPGPTPEYGIEWNTGSGTFRALYVDTTPTYIVVMSSSVVPTAGPWYFVCGRFNGTNYDFFVNAVKATTFASTVDTRNGTGPLYLGGFGAGPVNTVTIDQAFFYNVALTDTQVANMYNGGAGVQYPFVGVP